MWANTAPLKVAQSRIIARRINVRRALVYQRLTVSPEAGVDIFAKRLNSQFVFFQGHPESDPLALQREYRRDITWVLSRQRDSYPAFPAGYFDAATEHKLAHYEKRARAERRIPLSIELPHLTLRPDLAVGVAAAALFGNWLEYLSDSVKLRNGAN